MGDENDSINDDNEKQRDNSRDFEDIDDVDIDPVNAYFRQRCSRGSSNSLFKVDEFTRDSSLGFLDIDNASELDEMDKLSYNGKLEDTLSVLYEKSQTGNAEEDVNNEAVAHNIKYPCLTKSEQSSSELNLIKQRELAKKTLLQLNDKLEVINRNLNALDIDNDNDKGIKADAEKQFIINHGVLNGRKNNWLVPNQSPQTPRFFKNELNSMSEDSQTPVVKMKNKSKFEPLKENTNYKVTELKKVFTFDDLRSFRASSLTFEDQNPDEIISRFEEDERKFLKEQSALSNNSNISQFSGVGGEGDLVQLARKEASEEERISIGKYFELRSHSINSLVGTKTKEVSGDFDVREPVPSTSVLHGAENDCDKINPRKSEIYPSPNASKPWDLSNEIRRGSDTFLKRHSNESSESASTLLIQNLLCGMESGLSGTQINDKLLECIGKIKSEKNLKATDVNAPTDMETPKSSKTIGKTGNARGSTYRKRDKINGKSSPEGKKFEKSSSVSSSWNEFKENIPKKIGVNTITNEHIKKGKHLMGFNSSTPKLENLKCNTDKFKSACSKLLMNDKDWEPPRISSIRKPSNLNETGKQFDKTIVLNSTLNSDVDRKENANAKESINLEDTIAGGDLTVISERICEMEKESSCVVRRSPLAEKDALAVVRKLINYPKGSVDCSALTPMLREQYPELLSRLSIKLDQTRIVDSGNDLGLNVKEPVVTSTDSWINYSSRSGCEDNIVLPVEVRRLISTPCKNLTKDWLIVSLESLTIQNENKKNFYAMQRNDEFIVGEFFAASMKDTLIPPEDSSTLKIYFTPKVPVVITAKLTLKLQKLFTTESRTEDLTIGIDCVFPKDNITITPKDEVNFGVIPEECCGEEIVNFSFDGICDLPIKIFIDECYSFVFSSEVMVNEEYLDDCAVKSDEFSYTFKEGMKTNLQLKVLFQSHLALRDTNNVQKDFKGTLTLIVDVPIQSCILKQIPINGSVAFAKFLCNPSFSPLIFRTTEIGQPVKRSFPLKNVGALGIEFSLTVVRENSHEEQTDDLFSTPKSFILPKGEERSVDIIFSGRTKDSYVRRYLLFQMKPNGQVFYDVELVGVVMPVKCGKSVSQSSSRSGVTQSAYNTGDIAFKLKSTTQSISWAAVPLDAEVKQSFHILNSSSCNAVARFTFRRECSAFRFLNENGEVIEKLRKVLKPNCSNVMTVLFRPDKLGPHKNSIIIETNHVSGRKMISLNGYGGSPKIFIRNLKSDLNGSKNIRLINSQPEDQIFHASLEFINKGNVSGFVSIRTVVKVLSLSGPLEVEPSNFVLLPNTVTRVVFNQKLKSDDIKLLLSGRDVGKLATVIVTTGDDPGRFRLRKLINEQGIKTSESISFLLSNFINEQDIDIDNFDDDKNFESVFRKNVETIEIAAVIERPTDVCEPTIFEDFEETVKEFATILPATDSFVSSISEFEKSNAATCKKLSLEKTFLSASSGEFSNPQDGKIKKWLATIVKP